MSNSSCLIDADPDVAGIGVRVAVYLQALLPLVSVLFIPQASISFADAAVVEKYCKRGNTSLTVLSFTTAALLIVAFIKHGKKDLSPYHALVVLNLTWIILISSCWRAAIIYHLQKHGILESLAQQTDEGGSRAPPGRPEKVWDLRAVLLETSNRRRAPTFTLHVLALCLHLTATGILGCLLFSDIRRFSGASNKGCPDETILWMGVPVHITKTAPRTFWWFAYAVAALSPILLPISVFFAVFCGHLISSALVGFYRAVTTGAVALYDRIPHAPSTKDATVGDTEPKPQSSPQSVLKLALIGFELLSVVVLVLLIISTEKTIAKNPVRKGNAGEGDWGFGQILALILCAIPLYEAVQDSLMGRKMRTASARFARLSRASGSFVLRKVRFEDRVFAVRSSNGRIGHIQQTLLVYTARVAAVDAVIIDPAAATSDHGNDSQDAVWSAEVIEVLERTVAQVRAQGDGIKVGVRLNHLVRYIDQYPRSNSYGWTKAASVEALSRSATLEHESTDENRPIDRGRTQESYSDDSTLNPDERYPEGLQGVTATFLRAVQLCDELKFDFIEVLTKDGYLPEANGFAVPSKSTSTLGGELEERSRMTWEILRAVRENWLDRPLSVCVEWTRNWTSDDGNKLANLLSAAGADLVTASSDGFPPLTSPVLHIGSSLTMMIDKHGHSLEDMAPKVDERGTTGNAPARLV